MSRILRNAMRTPDGTVIESFFRHDFQQYKDANTETYMVDGGMDYLRRSRNDTPAEDLSVESIDGNHEHNRAHYKWGTYGKSGEEKFRRVLLKDMSTPHIEAVLETQHLEIEARGFFEEEIKYRVNKQENK